MDDKLDMFVDSIFGGGNLIYISGAISLVLIIIGVVLLLRKKSDGTRSPKIAGIICVVAGIGVILSGIAQSLPLF